MRRFTINLRFRHILHSAVLGVGALTLAGCESAEVGTVKPPDVKDRAEVLPGFDPKAKSPYSAGATVKKNAPQPTEADKALPANTNPSL
ncbi:MAG: hypothetical protein U0790_10500 [Isosphaeraceae bacterium]